MSDDNKEGAGVPVAVVGKGNGGGVGITYLPALYSLPHGTKLYATPPAAMPAAPSDAEILAVLPPKSGLAPSNLEAVRQGLVGAFRPVWTEPAMLEFARSVLALSQNMQPQAEPAAGQTSSIAEKALQEIATLTNRTATPEQFARHLQRIASKALNGEYDE